MVEKKEDREIVFREACSVGKKEARQTARVGCGGPRWSERDRSTLLGEARGAWRNDVDELDAHRFIA